MIGAKFSPFNKNKVCFLHHSMDETNLSFNQVPKKNISNALIFKKRERPSFYYPVCQPTHNPWARPY